MARQFVKTHDRAILTVILVAAFAWSLSAVPWDSTVIHAGGKAAILQMLKAMVRPDLSPETLKLALVSSWRTLAYAVAGMSLAIAIALVFGVLAAGILVTGRGRLAVMGFFRGVLGFMRAIHELVWAWLFVAATGLSPLTAVFALAIPYGGTLGRILADMLNDVPPEPIRALRASGAGKLQLLFYGYLPMAMADMTSYIMYRLECAIRSATIMSFVGLGGLGYQIHLSLQDLHYNQVWTFIFFLTALVMLVDLWSNQLRRGLVP